MIMTILILKGAWTMCVHASHACEPWLKYFHYIKTSEIPGELSRENFISSHMKKTCYLHTWRDHRRYAYIINRTWYFTGVYIINRILHARLWIWILSSRVQLGISLVRYRVDHSKIKFISTRGHVISSILALFDLKARLTWNAWLAGSQFVKNLLNQY